MHVDPQLHLPFAGCVITPVWCICAVCTLNRPQQGQVWTYYCYLALLPSPLELYAKKQTSL